MMKKMMTLQSESFMHQTMKSSEKFMNSFSEITLHLKVLLKVAIRTFFCIMSV